MSTNVKMSIEPANEDTVQCLFFSITLGSDIKLWEELCQKINNTITDLSKNYIWHRDEFQVYLPITEPKETGVPIHLYSNTCFGDNIEDEWFIVHLVLEISKQFTDVIIQVMDNDGDFLLIEAADYLDTWVNPGNTENRVFLYNNHIHIIPTKAIALETKVELNTALKVISESPESTRASSNVEQAILRRIGNYPEKILKDLHQAVVTLPSKLAALLLVKPSLIAPIINAFCNHDIIDAKCCKSIEFNDCVTVELKFTKFLYAKLMHTKLINSVKHYASNNDKKSILGLKLMCGYQMIMNNQSTDLFSSKDYHRFVNSLKQNGYFKNNLEGSKEYNQLLEKAKEYFTIAELPINLGLSHNITQMLNSDDYKQTKDSIKEKHLVNPEQKGDNEDWLNINPEELNELLLNRYGKSSKLKENDVISSTAVTTELSSFLKQTSDFEGIEPDHCEKSDENNIEFESDQFVSCIEKMLHMLSTGCEAVSDNSDDDFDEMNYNDDDDDCDRELEAKLQKVNSEDLKDSKTILANIIQSMKEEKASAGPTSTILSSLGVHKSEILDSDDDVD